MIACYSFSLHQLQAVLRYDGDGWITVMTSPTHTHARDAFACKPSEIQAITTVLHSFDALTYVLFSTRPHTVDKTSPDNKRSKQRHAGPHVPSSTTFPPCKPLVPQRWATGKRDKYVRVIAERRFDAAEPEPDAPWAGRMMAMTPNAVHECDKSKDRELLTGTSEQLQQRSCGRGCVKLGVVQRQRARRRTKGDER